MGYFILAVILHYFYLNVLLLMKNTEIKDLKFTMNNLVDDNTRMKRKTK